MIGQPNSSSSINIDEIPCQEISDPAALAKMPLVSVKMITYNHEAYIAQAIEGVLMQKTDFPIELVIGEDRSTDRTREIVLEYQNKHPDIIRVITSEQNVGWRKNSLRTSNACRGKYIALCEGDDYWIDSKKILKQTNFLETNLNFVGCFTNGEYIDLISKAPPRLFYNKPGKDVYNLNDMIINQSTHTCTLMFRKSAIFPYPDSYSSIQVGHLPNVLVACLKGPMKYIDSVTAVYRKHTGGVWSGSDYYTNLMKHIGLLIHIRDLFPKKHRVFFNRGISQLYVNLSLFYLEQFSLILFISFLSRALQKSPIAILVFLSRIIRYLKIIWRKLSNVVCK